MPHRSHHFADALLMCGLFAFALAGVYFVGFTDVFATHYLSGAPEYAPPPWPLPLDTSAYNARMLALAHYVPSPLATTTATTTVAATSTPSIDRSPGWTATTSVSVPGRLWPHPAAYPEGGALLPFNRIVAYYGNFLSKNMGVLGAYPPDEVLAMLASTTATWAAADPSTPVIPAIQYIVTVAQGSAGASGLYRAQMPEGEIDKALAMARKARGILILDVQVGKSTLAAELPPIKKYLEMPDVHLAIDPEFSMKFGNAPGTVIGTYDAPDINYAAEYLATIVRARQLPPKVLIVHRFTLPMVTNYQNVKPLPEVEIVLDMDGWGSQAKKIGTYTAAVYAQPIQFTGIKLFYKNDLKPPSTGLLTPAQVLDLMPSPSYIQYQ